MNEWNVLVVEDDPDGQEVVARMLKYHKINATVVGSAEDALTTLIDQRFTAVLIDLALPGMDGWTLLHTIQRNPKTAYIPCVAMTAFHSADLAVKAIEAGFMAYFPKPLETTSFVRELQRVIG
jgi:CheY-like chemotaxis protein